MDHNSLSCAALSIPFVVYVHVQLWRRYAADTDDDDADAWMRRQRLTDSEMLDPATAVYNTPDLWIIHNLPTCLTTTAAVTTFSR